MASKYDIYNIKQPRWKSYLLFVFVVFSFLLLGFAFLWHKMHAEPFPKDVAGKVIWISSGISKRTFKLDTEEKYFGGYKYFNGLEVGDSVHIFVMADPEYYKKDSTGQFKEVIPGDDQSDEWHFIVEKKRKKKE